MDREGAKAKAVEVGDALFRIVTILMAIAMILYVVAEIYHNIKFYGIFGCAIYYGVPFVCALLILLDRHRSVFFAVGMFAISIGFSRFLKYGTMILSESGESIFSLAMFYGGIVLTILALNMMYSGYRYIKRNSRSVTYIIISTFLFSAVIMGEIIMRLRSTEDTMSFLAETSNLMATLFMYLIYLGLVWSEPVRRSTNLEKLENTLTTLRVDNSVGLDLSMRKGAIDRFVGFVSGEIPGDLHAAGPVTSRIRVKAHDGLVWMTYNLERWDDGRVYMTVDRSEDDSALDPTVFIVEDAKFQDGELAVRFGSGRVSRFRIRGESEDEISMAGVLD
ncbi:MAG: hypothetical protein IKP20_06010 [Candidatus Methanomethylophilaceae archaeon]|nr:hypothetical protein [Candidatus Methanomethylophilaceae archaeon]